MIDPASSSFKIFNAMKGVLNSLNLPENGKWEDWKQRLQDHFESEGESREKEYLQAIKGYFDHRQKFVYSGEYFHITKTRLLFKGSPSTSTYLLALDDMLRSFEGQEKNDKIQQQINLFDPKLTPDVITQKLKEFQTHSLKYGLRKGDSPVYKALVEPSYGK
eukprot:GHVT01089395.1.p1 GENE.GHVT01089395.1~~GHVT01089395.1.p1  ORF type:complete len:162 (+),score=0.73 GHVT01089395.1:394-879(+)